MGRALADQLFGDGIGGKIRTEAHQFNRCGVGSFDVLKGQRPGGGNRVRMTGNQSTTPVEQFSPLLLVDAQVVGHTLTRFLDIGSCLIKGKRKPVHGTHDVDSRGTICRRGTLKGRIFRDDACSSQQELRPLFWSHGVQFDLASQTTHRLGAGGEQGVPLCAFWEIVPDHRQIVGIVEDEQPAGVRLKPLFHGMDHHLLLPGISLGEMEQLCQGDEVQKQGFGGVGLDPQDERIAARER